MHDVRATLCGHLSAGETESETHARMTDTTKTAAQGATSGEPPGDQPGASAPPTVNAVQAYTTAAMRASSAVATTLGSMYAKRDPPPPSTKQQLDCDADSERELARERAKFRIQWNAVRAALSNDAACNVELVNSLSTVSADAQAVVRDVLLAPRMYIETHDKVANLKYDAPTLLMCGSAVDVEVAGSCVVICEQAERITARGRMVVFVWQPCHVVRALRNVTGRCLLEIVGTRCADIGECPSDFSVPSGLTYHVARTSTGRAYVSAGDHVDYY